MGSKSKTIRNSIGLLSASVIMISLAGKVFGFLRELLLAKYFGTTSTVDVYLMSYTIPAVLFGALPALGVGFTPIYFKIHDKQEKRSFLTKTLMLSWTVALFCIILTYLFDDSIVNLCARGFTEEAKVQTVSYLRITVWSILFNTPVQVLISYLNCNKNYINSSLSGLTISITNALFITLAAHYGDKILPLGYLVPYILQFFWLLVASFAIGYRPSIKESDHAILKQLLVLALPICISNILIDINGFVDKMLASSLPEGSLSALNYAFTLRAVIVTVFQAVISTIYYPSLSELYAEQNYTSFNNCVKNILSVAALFIIPINILGLMLSKEIIQVVLMRGNFNANSLELTSTPFVMYLLSLSFIIIRELFIRIMYISGDSKSNLFFGGANVLINVILSIALVGGFKHSGLALATSIAAIITFPLYLVKIKHILPSLRLRGLLMEIVKMVLSAACMGFAVSLLKKVVVFNPLEGFIWMILKLVFYIAIGSIVYLLLLYLLKNDQIKTIVNAARNKTQN